MLKSVVVCLLPQISIMHVPQNIILKKVIYSMNRGLVKLDSFKDLGVIFDSKLNFGEHIKEKINKAYSVIGVIKINFIHIDKSSFIV